MELSLILLKPDIYENKEALTDLNNLINNSRLETVLRMNVLLDKKKIVNIWNQFLDDYVSQELLYLYFNNQTLKCIILKGEDALDKTREIKKIIRKRYSKSIIQNCIHSPDTFEEFIHDIKIFNNLESTCYTRNNKILPEKFTKYNKLDEDYLKAVSLKLWSTIVRDSEFYNSWLINHKSVEFRYKLYLIPKRIKLNEFISMKYIVAVIFELIFEIDLFDAYVVVLNALKNGKSLLISSNNFEYIRYINLELINLDIYNEIKILDKKIGERNE